MESPQLDALAERLANVTPEGLVSFYRGLRVTLRHPIYDRLPDALEVAGMVAAGRLEAFHQLLQSREEAIRLMADEPRSHGWRSLTPDRPPGMAFTDYRPMWGDSLRLMSQVRELLIVGGNRSGKSEFAADFVGDVMSKWTTADGGKPPIVWCLSTSEETSKRDQQPLVWKYLPQWWRYCRSNSIKYNERMRFASNFFVAPNHTECWFKFYRQDPDSIEGGQIDLAWADEELPVDQMITLRGRLIDRHGKLLVTFTPIHGMNSTMSDFVAGAKVVETCDCESFPNDKLWPGLPPGKIPYIMECMDPQRAIIFFQPKWNPWIDYKDLVRTWESRGRQNILIRLHGVTSKTSGGQFPKFGRHNIIPAARIPKEGTDWHFMDFANNRPWAHLWFRVKRVGARRFIYVVKDWPDKSSYGEWVVPADSKKDGQRGPAQNPVGYGAEWYAELIKMVESKYALNVLDGQRKGDPRSGNVGSMEKQDGRPTIFGMMDEVGVQVDPARGADIVEGINLINDWLDYNEEKPIDEINQPSLYISEECEQLIDCLRMWTGIDGFRGASKDFVDLMRYAAVEDIDELSAEMFQPRAGWGGY